MPVIASSSSSSSSTTTVTPSKTAPGGSPPQQKPVVLPPLRIHSRAVLLVQREVTRLLKSHPWGITLHEVDDARPLSISAVIQGPKDTPWEGGILNINVIYPEEYDDKPPALYMTTVPFHPNIDIFSGQICSDFLDDKDEGGWKGNISLESLLVAVQFLLVNPSLDRPINDTAAAYLRDTPQTYHQMVRDCVLASRRLDAGMPAFMDSTSELPASTSPSPIPVIPKRIAPVSFEAYRDSWRELATSQPAPQSETRYSQSQMKKMFRKHMSLFYGKFKFNDPSTMRFRDKERFRTERISTLQHTYGITHRERCEAKLAIEQDFVSENEKDGEPPDDEVDAMLRWCDTI